LLLAGKKAGMLNELWEDITGFMAQKSFAEIAENWIRTHAVACQRRHHEIAQVLETLREIGVDPIMTTGTEAFFRRSVSLELKEHYHAKPESFTEVIDFLHDRLS
jgi:hypothetical protein